MGDGEVFVLFAGGSVQLFDPAGTPLTGSFAVGTCPAGHPAVAIGDGGDVFAVAFPGFADADSSADALRPADPTQVDPAEGAMRLP